jgi:hypothetical protein
MSYVLTVVADGAMLFAGATMTFSLVPDGVKPTPWATYAKIMPYFSWPPSIIHSRRLLVSVSAVIQQQQSISPE